MRLHSRPGLAREGQVFRPSRNQVLDRVGTVTPIATRRPTRSWSATDARLRDMGDVSVWIERGLLDEMRSCGRGRPYTDTIISTAVAVAHLCRLPLRQTEGMLRGWFRLSGLNPDLVPDHTTICRRRRHLPTPVLPTRQGPAVLVVDATGCSIRTAAGWHFDKPGAHDRRRTKYVKLHVGIDADTGVPVVGTVTAAAGPGSGDASQGPVLIKHAATRLATVGGHLAGGIGDGAYDSTGCYQVMQARGRGMWLAPPPTRARKGSHPVRDRHIDGVRRLGDVYMDRVGYHQRSTVEACFGALKRTVGLTSRARTLDQQTRDIMWQVALYADVLDRHGR
jgi:hypothetical protein